MEFIFDHIKQDLDILFIGFNPSVRSGETGHHYANPNNRFWTILHHAGITPRKYAPTEDFKLLELNYGLTNIVSRPTVGAADITREEYKEGRRELKEKIVQNKPRIACFVGKGVYQEYSGRRTVEWGAQEEEIVPGTTDFVAPSSSGLVRMKLEEIVAIYKNLDRMKQELSSK